MDTKSKMVLMVAAILFLLGASLLYYGIMSHPNHPTFEATQDLVDRLSTKEEEQRCFSDIKQQYEFKDESSLRIEGETKTYFYEGTTRQVTLHLNGKNSYGGYTGPKDFSCFYTIQDNKLQLIYSNDY